jgi:hypothetical protein
MRILVECDNKKNREAAQAVKRNLKLIPISKD